LGGSTVHGPVKMPTLSAQSGPLAQALSQETPLQIVGTINAYCALLAESVGFRAIYLSGAGVANASFGLPDLGVTTLNDVAEEVRRITAITRLPLLVDADTGWGTDLTIARTVQSLSRAGAAAMHLEDQQTAKRCGHRPGKALVEAAEMVNRIRAAVDARTDPGFAIMARTDALASEGLPAALDRCHQYVEAGADMIFAEAVTKPEQYAEFTRSLSVPVLANMTEFGATPLLSLDQLRQSGIAMVLYPLTAFRAMNHAALEAYETLRQLGTQTSLLNRLQTRDKLYDVLNYHKYERMMDHHLQKGTR
jgi:methylisocitrate lyase